MKLRNAALLALIGTVILTVLLAVDFINVLLGVSRGLVPAITLLRTAVYAFASLSVTIFFTVFGRSQ